MKYTVKQFLDSLWSVGYRLGLNRSEFENQWLETDDFYGMEEQLSRLHLARICHKYMLQYLKETDTEEWEYAKQMADLYDCHTCVNHIAQVICKGILKPVSDQGKYLFLGRQAVYEQEAAQTIERIFDKQKRYPVSCSGSVDRKCSGSLKLDLKEIIDSDGQYAEGSLQIIDVRPRRLYEQRHIRGALPVSFTDLMEGKQLQLIKRELPVLVYCEKGYLSRIAADYLADSGYQPVYYGACENML